jgi:integrase
LNLDRQIRQRLPGLPAAHGSGGADHRRCPLWPETIAAVREALAHRPANRQAEHDELVFITQRGDAWAKEKPGSPVTKETGKLLDRLGIERQGRNFYTLRHTFRTVADEAKDQPAANFCMGHEDGHISQVYRERICDERLRAVSNHVRAWLFGDGKAVSS